jgi:Zn finger protein HypA/HybF involved in hydrogenase expression
MSGDVIPFRKPEPEPKAELTAHGEAVCLDCRKTWVQVAPVGMTVFECPDCKTERGVWQRTFGAQPGQFVFVCYHCKSEHLTVIYGDKAGAMRFHCVGCGIDQTGSLWP